MKKNFFIPAKLEARWFQVHLNFYIRLSQSAFRHQLGTYMLHKPQTEIIGMQIPLIVRNYCREELCRSCNILPILKLCRGIIKAFGKSTRKYKSILKTLPCKT